MMAEGGTFPSATLDPETLAIYVRLRGGQPASTHQLDDAHLVDIDGKGRPIGIEILSVNDWKIVEMAERFGFARQVSAIEDAIGALFPPTLGTGSSGPTISI